MYPTIQREAIAPLWRDLTPLLERHRAEVAPYPDWDLAPDRDLYNALDDIGRLRVYTVRAAGHPDAHHTAGHPKHPLRDDAHIDRDETTAADIHAEITANSDPSTASAPSSAAPSPTAPGDLIGYCIMTIGPNPHYTAVTIAAQDVLFLLPEHRHGGLGLRLLRHVESDLRTEGVHCIAQRTKTRPDLHLGALFTRLGYTEVDQVWLKRLDPNAAPPSQANADTGPAHPESPAFRRAGPRRRTSPPLSITDLHRPRRDAEDFYPTPAED